MVVMVLCSYNIADAAARLLFTYAQRGKPCVCSLVRVRAFYLLDNDDQAVAVLRWWDDVAHTARSTTRLLLYVNVYVAHGIFSIRYIVCTTPAAGGAAAGRSRGLKKREWSSGTVILTGRKDSIVLCDIKHIAAYTY